MIRVKRVYETPSPADGYRVLVDRLWPRGLTKQAAALDAWLRDLAPSDALRRWVHHAPARWSEFVRRYREELRSSRARELMEELLRRAATGAVTLLFAARDEDRNNAVALRDTVMRLFSPKTRRRTTGPSPGGRARRPASGRSSRTRPRGRGGATR